MAKITNKDVGKFVALAKNDVEGFISQWTKQTNSSSSDAALSYGFYANQDNRSIDNGLKFMLASGGDTGGGGGGAGGSVGTSAGGGSFGPRKLPGAGTEAKSIFDIWGLITSADKLSDILQTIAKETLGQMILNLEQEANLHRQISEQTSMSLEFVDAMSPSIMQAYRNATLLGYSFEEVTGAVTKIFTDAGRFKMVGDETLDSLTKTSRLFYDNLAAGAESIANFQNVSLGAKEAMDAAMIAGRRAMSLGLNARETVRVLNKEISRLNQFGFKEGVDGLTRMVQKAQSLRMDMSKTFELADKMMDPTKALELAANLQVIGGAMGEFQDPIKLMYMATNDVEGLQDALIGTVENLVTFNNESGRFEIVGANLRRLRATAEALGMDYKDLANTAVQSAQRMSAATDLMGTGIVFADEEEKEFLINLAQMKGGRMIIEVPEELQKALGTKEIALEDMNQKQYNELIEMRKKMTDKKPEELLAEQVHSIDRIDRKLTWFFANLRGQFGAAGEEIAAQLGISWEFLEGVMQQNAGKAVDVTKDIITGGTQALIDLGKTLNITAESLRSVLEKFLRGESAGGTQLGPGVAPNPSEGGTQLGPQNVPPNPNRSNTVYYPENETNTENMNRFAQNNRQSRTIYLRFVADNSILDPIARSMARNPQLIEYITDGRSYVAPTGFQTNA